MACGTCDLVCDVVLDLTTNAKYKQTFDIVDNKSTRPIQAAGVTQCKRISQLWTHQNGWRRV